MPAGIKACSEELSQLGWVSAYQPRASGWQVVATRHTESLLMFGPDLRCVLELIVVAARRRDHRSDDLSASSASITSCTVAAPTLVTERPVARAKKTEVIDPEIARLLVRAREACAEAARVQANADREIAESRSVLNSYHRNRAKRLPS